MIRTLLTLLFALGTLTCAAPPPIPEAPLAPHPDFERVAELSEDLADLGLQLEDQYLWWCGDRDLEPSPGSNYDVLPQELRRELRERWVVRCDLFAEILSNTRTVVAGVVETGVVPAGLLTFPLYTSYCEDDRPDGLILTSLVPITIQVGPFRDVEACDAAALSFRSTGFQTGGCRVWQAVS